MTNECRLSFVIRNSEFGIREFNPMSTFTYTVRDPQGKTHEGKLESSSREEATARLRKDGFQVVELDDEAEDFDLLPKRIKQSDVIFLTSQLAVMVDTGITLSAAIDIIAQQE